MFCVTTPMVVGIMYWANTFILPGKHWLASLVFNLFGSGTLLSLWATSFSDPGILERQRVNRSGGRMRWNNNASSFVPSHAMYDSDCGVVIEVCLLTSGQAKGASPAFPCFALCYFHVGLILFCLMSPECPFSTAYNSGGPLVQQIGL